MFTTDLRRRLAAALCTLAMSTACVLGAVGPAQTAPLSFPGAAIVTQTVA